MDFHVLIVIACVFLASFFSLLFINKFFRGKTFEEVAAEKRLLAEKLYGSKSKRNGSNSKKNNNNASNASKQLHKRKNSNPKNPVTGILSNKIESMNVKEAIVAEPLSEFEIIQPKDVEVKRQIKEENTEGVKTQRPAKEENSEGSKSQKTISKDSKKPKQVKKEVVEKVEIAPQQEVLVAASAKELKQPDEKPIKQVDSPKIQSKPIKKKKPDGGNPPPTAAASNMRKELAVPTVNSLMSTLNRAELTRGEIQILIDYLLNKQQDTTANHSEWSDDIVQKLRKKLEEKEKAFEEEQNTSAGIQAKLRELRATINTERVQHNATVKAYNDEVQSHKFEIQNLTQDMNDKMEKLKEQYNLLKMQLYNQDEHFNHQILLSQINKLNQTQDNAKRNAIIGEIQEILQPNNDEIIQLQNEILTLRNEIMLLNNKNNSLMMSWQEAESKILCQSHDQEEDKAKMQMQITNLQATLDSVNLMQSNSQNHVHNLTTQIDDLNMQLGVINNKYIEQVAEMNGLQTILNNYETTIQEKDSILAKYESNIRNLMSNKEEMMKEICEQKEKNNDLRTKNWKLVEALQKAETNAVKNLSKNLNNLVQPIVSSQSQEDRLRELFQRLFPEAVSSSTSSALSLSFDQWIEQIISTHINEITRKHQAELSKQAEQLKQFELNSIVNKSNSDHCNSNNHTESLNNHKEDDSNNGNSNQDIILQNAQLRAQVAELKSVVINTESTLNRLESQALEQDSKWLAVVKVKQEEIDMLKNSNRQAV